MVKPWNAGGCYFLTLGIFSKILFVMVKGSELPIYQEEPSYILFFFPLWIIKGWSSSMCNLSMVT